MTVRKWFVVAAVAAAPAAAPAAGPAPAGKPVMVFGTLRAVPADAARAKLEAGLRAAGRLDPAALDAVWKDAGRSVTDRVTDVLLRAYPDAAAAVAEVRKPGAVAPAAVPAAVTDGKLDPFVRANLAFAYAKAAAGKRSYEAALDALKAAPAEQVVDPAGYYFYKAVAEHALMLREAATGSIVRLLDDVADAPDRYKMVATLLFFDLQTWPKDEKDLTNIGKLMDNSGRRLDLAMAGTKTQDIQKKIVFRLDEKIKEMENQQKGGGAGRRPAAVPERQPARAGAPSGTPAPDSTIMGTSGPGKVDEKKLRQYADVWGKLPAAERAKAVQELTRDSPPRFRPMIEEYFKSLNRLNGFTP